MIRCVAVVLGCGALFTSMSAAQVTYSSPFRTITASSGDPGGLKQASATAIEDWVEALSSIGAMGAASASQQSSLGSMGASLTLVANAAGPATASSVCNFSFVPAAPMSVSIVGEGTGDDVTFSLVGPGVSLSRSASESGSNWNLSAALQAGQSYTFLSSARDSGSLAAGDLQLSLTFQFAPGPQGRAYSYQGVVRDALGQPITTPTDLEFRLFFHPTEAGTQVGPTLTASGIVPDKGVFTRELDFGDVFNGDALWLEVRVRNPAGSGTFTPVLPRTPIASVPYSSHALRATTASYAATAGTASSATNATSAATAATALTANNAINAPWSGLTGQAGVTTGSIGGGWQFLFNNNTVGNFRGGARLADSGFFEITNSAQLGNPNFARLASNGGWTAVSDARLKTDVTREDPAAMLDAALHLNPVRFVWKATGAADSGLLAQEVRTVAPALVAGSEEGGLLTVDYSKIGVIAVGAVQAQQAEIRQLRERVSKAEAENAELRGRLDRLERLLDSR